MFDSAPVPSYENANVIICAGLGGGAAGVSHACKLYVAFGRPPLTVNTLMRLAAVAGEAAVRSEPLLEDFLSLINEVKIGQDARGGDGARIIGSMPTEDVIGFTDMSWANARDRHPVLIMVFESAVNGSLATGAAGRLTKTEGFPSRPFALLAEAINSVMSPETRLPLESVSSNDLLRLITLSAAASGNDSLTKHYLMAGQPGLPENYDEMHVPGKIVSWLIDGDRHTPGLDPICIDDIVKDESRYSAVLGSAKVNRLRHLIIESSMRAAITGFVPAPPEASAHAMQSPKPRRGMRML